METKNKKTLETILKEDDRNGIQFNISKQKLLKLGYTDDEISIAVASLPFDGKENKPKSPPEMSELYNLHPEVTQDVARTLLEMENEKQKQKMVAHAIQYSAASSLSSVPNPYSSQSFASLAGDVGYPFFKIALLGLFLTAAVYGLHFFNLISLDVVFTFVYIYIFIASFYFLILLLANLFRPSTRTEPSDSKARRKYRIKKIIGTLISIIILGISILLNVSHLFK